jgi:hypothetical protein
VPEQEDNMADRKREQKINELLELMNIPEIEAAVFHHLNLIKNEAKDEINLYRNLRNGFMATVFEGMYVYTGEQQQEEFPVYYFEAQRKAPNNWVLTDINPQPPDEVDIDEIIPRDIINLIGAQNIEFNSIKSLKNEVETPSGYKSFFTRFARHSDYLVVGSIRRIKTWREQGGKKKSDSASEDQAAPQGRSRVVKNAVVEFKDRDDLGTVKTLFYYIQKYPEVKYQLCEDFYNRIKPRIDRKMSTQAISG